MSETVHQFLSFTWWPKITTSLVMLLVASTACGFQAAASMNDETPLPEWVQQGSFEQDGSDYILVETEGCVTALDANRELDIAISKAISTALDQKLGEGAGQRVKLGPEYIAGKLIPDKRSVVRPYRNEFTDEIAQRLGKEYGEFFRGYAQLKLDPAFYTFARQQWRSEQTRLRLMAIALISLIVLALLTTTYGYLRVNQATRGFYSVRLLTFGLAAILLLTAAALVLFRNLPL